MMKCKKCGYQQEGAGKVCEKCQEPLIVKKTHRKRRPAGYVHPKIIRFNHLMQIKNGRIVMCAMVPLLLLSSFFFRSSVEAEESLNVDMIIRITYIVVAIVFGLLLALSYFKPMAASIIALVVFLLTLVLHLALTKSITGTMGAVIVAFIYFLSRSLHSSIQLKKMKEQASKNAKKIDESIEADAAG